MGGGERERVTLAVQPGVKTEEITYSALATSHSFGFARALRANVGRSCYEGDTN